ncbi:MAG: metallophosphoesterase [Planctomycetes bacterium]|nr:metallophosphoesterase [Planctomycetota bacterium]
MNRLLVAPLALLLAASASSQDHDDHGQPPVKAPFAGLDTVCVNDWWNRPPSKIVDTRVPRDQVICFGIYTVHGGVLKLSAQLFPLYPAETREVRLELKRDGEWQQVATAEVNDLGWSALFRIAGWDSTQDVDYRLRHGERATFQGRIRKDPTGDVVTMCALSCNSNRDRGDRASYVRNINHQDPDLVFFAGDQSYDHKEHTAAWLAFGLQFRDVFRDRPCVTIPDDHDIGQPNVWGESGKVSTLPGCADGGYAFDKDYVRMVERCQTAHLPDPFDPTPIGQGIGVYYTSLIVGGVDFAIVEDRKFKSGPAGKIPQQGPRPDHITDPAYDPRSIDLPELVLLGERQLHFLDVWGEQRDGVAMKAVLSQTGFCGGAHLHGSKDNRLHGDLDSNGWPQRGRDEALRRIAAAHAVHIAGDQHLATLVKHGIDDFRDGPWAFVVPAIVNSIYSRWWWPENGAAGGGHDPEDLLPWTGDYRDGFGNRITMYAYANPETPSHGSGYGRVLFDKRAGKVTFECWPRGVDVTKAGAPQFVGWPRTVTID